MPKNPVNAVVWVAQKMGKSLDSLEELVEGMPEKLTSADVVTLDADPEINLQAHGKSLQMQVEDGGVWDISFSFAQELLEPVSNHQIYQISRLFIK